MKSNMYIKVILTIIAICLIWICVRDIKIGEKSVYANNMNSAQDFEVSVSEIAVAAEAVIYRAVEHGVAAALIGSQPISVRVR